MIVSLLLDAFRGRPFSIGYVQGAGILVGAFLILLALKPDWVKKMFELLGKALQATSAVVALVGALLLIVNLVGIPLSLRNPKIYQEPGYQYGGRRRTAQFTPAEVYRQTDRRPDESVEDYVLRLNTLIYAGTVHYWEDEGMEEYNIRVPFYENFILYFTNHGEKYLYCDAEKAIERGVSLCTQATVILMDIFESQGIEAQKYALRGHTVALVQVDAALDVWWFDDADYGVVIAEDYRNVEENPELIRQYYQAAGYGGRLLDILVGYYGGGDNYSQGFLDEQSYCDRETQAYRLKWLIPGIAIAQFLLLYGVIYAWRKWRAGR